MLLFYIMFTHTIHTCVCVCVCACARMALMYVNVCVYRSIYTTYIWIVVIFQFMFPIFHLAKSKENPWFNHLFNYYSLSKLSIIIITIV